MRTSSTTSSEGEGDTPRDPARIASTSTQDGAGRAAVREERLPSDPPSLGFVLEQVQSAASSGVPRVHLDISSLEEAGTPYGSECLVRALTKKGLTAQAIRAGNDMLFLSISGWAD